MIIYKFDAIRMPKEASGLKKDTYMLLVYASCDLSVAYLPNGRRYHPRTWESHSHDIGKHFFTKEEYWSIVEQKPYIATDDTINGEGKPTMHHYHELVSDTFAKARTIEEIGELTLTIASSCKASKDFYLMCKDFSSFGRLDFSRGASNVDVDYLEYAIKPYYVIRLQNGTYLGPSPNKIPTYSTPFRAYQSLSESEALNMVDEYMDILGKKGYEIVRIEGADRNATLSHLKNRI